MNFQEREQNLRERAKKHISPVITRITDLVIERAHGARFWTVDQQEYIDFVSGVAVNAVGHTNQEVVQAIQEQASKLIHFGLNYGFYESSIKLAEKLAEITPGELDTVFFSNSGAEAIDGSIKFARSVTGRPVIIAFEGSFHGRTIGATSLTASSSKYRKNYEPLMGGVYHVPYPYQKNLGFENEDDCINYCFHRIDKLLEQQVDPTQIAAFIIEPVMGEGGYVPAPKRFLQQLRQLADKYGILLIFDEVQTGFGRTGKMFAAEHSGVIPDILVLAKALSSGMPLGAIVANHKLHQQWHVGGHGSTFGGNPVSCAAAHASIKVIQREKLVERSWMLGQEIIQRFHQSIGHLPYVSEIRGLGLMIGIEFQDHEGRSRSEIVSSIRKMALDKHLLITSCGVASQTIRLMLPLNISEEDLEQGISILEQTILNI